MIPSLSSLRLPETCGGRATAGGTRKVGKKDAVTVDAPVSSDPESEPVLRGPISVQFGAGDSYWLEAVQSAALHNMCRHKNGDNIEENYIKYTFRKAKDNDSQIWVLSNRKHGTSWSHPKMTVGVVVAFAVVNQNYDSSTRTFTVHLDLICASEGLGYGIRLFKSLLSHYVEELLSKSDANDASLSKEEKTTYTFEIHPINETVADLYNRAVFEELGVYLDNHTDEDHISQILVVDRAAIEKNRAELASSVVNSMDLG